LKIYSHFLTMQRGNYNLLSSLQRLFELIKRIILAQN
jgi:hypothetical protein